MAADGSIVKHCHFPYSSFEFLQELPMGSRGEGGRPDVT
ncbi:hypothetical protein SXCC_03176 [Gluconacetobacter sp. SXCC-1]|nr:hypothetical protein SXCC_03176 [Gluconacetobacter sp. SXCC-1]